MALSFLTSMPSGSYPEMHRVTPVWMEMNTLKAQIGKQKSLIRQYHFKMCWTAMQDHVDKIA